MAPLLVAAAMLAAAAAPAMADMAAWTAIAAKFATLLPNPLPGWKATSVVKRVSNTAFHKEIVVRQVYRPVGSGADTRINIGISAEPGWAAPWMLPLFGDAAKAKDRSWRHATVAGRRFLVQVRGEDRDDVTIVDRRITVYLFAKRATAAQVEAYIPHVDYRRLAGVR